ncbi:polysaccharide biosynthesis C-terminal domain-containing protein [Cellulophaga baltica]|uniref:oligosaccharide flippase family protein n=1 Tax=Cellulophaga baltica TaxID=76594 RepID=UPI0024946E0B|nr:polysaccharide biosynthesis C-terminal domain-containing protein [Cellulophaga baltica]
MKTSIYNIFFRGLTLVSKFIFIIFLGKYSIDETNLGVFGLLSTSIAFLIYIIGFDFYVFNTREIIASKINLVEKIKNQLVFHLSTYLIIIPISLLIVFNLNFIPIRYLWLFLALLISEHLGQELYRLFTTLEKSKIANIMLFIRSGLWIWVVIFDFFILKNQIDLYRYIVIWALFSYLSFLLFFILTIKSIGITKIKYSTPDWKWILSGLKTASVFFIGSLSFQVIQLSDRFMIDFFYGKKLVGIYTAYAQFTNAIDVFTFSAITMVAYPNLLSSFNDKKNYAIIKNKFSKNLLIASITLIALTSIIGPYIFKFLDKKAFLDELPTFYILLTSAFILIMSNVYHYDLYVKKKDKTILKIALLGMVINIILNLFLIPKYNIFGASIATLISFIIIFVLKFYNSKKILTK